MPLCIPERERPTRISIGEAFAYLVQKAIKPDSAIGRAGDLAAAVYFAGNVVSLLKVRPVTNQARNLVPVLEFLDTDPIDIAVTIEHGITSKKLSVEGLPESLMAVWAAQPVVADWASGMVIINIGDVDRKFYPTLNQAEVDALFAIGREDGQPSSSHTEFVSSVTTDEKSKQRARGTPPIKREAIKARILAALHIGKDIGDHDHEAITAEYGEGASRGTCVAALRKALSEFRGESPCKD